MERVLRKLFFSVLMEILRKSIEFKENLCVLRCFYVFVFCLIKFIIK